MTVLAFTSRVWFFVVNGVIYDLLLALIVVGTVVRLRFRSTSAELSQAMNIVAFIAAAAATLNCFGFFLSFYLTWSGGHPYEAGTLLRSRVAGPLTDLIHWIHPAFSRLPWAPYWWIFYVPTMADLNVGLLWLPAVRRRPKLILCATVPALVISRLLQLFTTYIILNR